MSNHVQCLSSTSEIPSLRIRLTMLLNRLADWSTKSVIDWLRDWLAVVVLVVARSGTLDWFGHFFCSSHRVELSGMNQNVSNLFRENDRLQNDRRVTGFQHDKQLEELRSLQVTVIMTVRFSLVPATSYLHALEWLWDVYDMSAGWWQILVLQWSGSLRDKMMLCFLPSMGDTWTVK